MEVQEVLARGEVDTKYDTLDRDYVRVTTVTLGDEKVTAVYKLHTRHERRSVRPTDYDWYSGDQTNPYLEDFAQYLARLTKLARVPAGVLRRVPGVTSPVWVQEFVKGKAGVLWPLDDYSEKLAQQHHDLLLFDCLIANDDRHGYNWFYTPQDEVIAIDHGCAFQNNDESVCSFVGVTQAHQVGKYLGLTPKDVGVYERAAVLPIPPRHKEALGAFLDAETEVRSYGESIGAPVETLDGIFGRAERVLRKGFLPTKYGPGNDRFISQNALQAR